MSAAHGRLRLVLELADGREYIGDGLMMCGEGLVDVHVVLIETSGEILVRDEELTLRQARRGLPDGFYKIMKNPAVLELRLQKQIGCSGLSWAAVSVTGCGHAIDGFREQVAITEPFNGLGSRGAVVDDPAADPFGAVDALHFMNSSPEIFTGLWSLLSARLLATVGPQGQNAALLMLPR